MLFVGLNQSRGISQDGSKEAKLRRSTFKIERQDLCTGVPASRVKIIFKKKGFGGSVVSFSTAWFTAALFVRSSVT